MRGGDFECYPQRLQRGLAQSLCSPSLGGMTVKCSLSPSLSGGSSLELVRSVFHQSWARGNLFSPCPMLSWMLNEVFIYSSLKIFSYFNSVILGSFSFINRFRSIVILLYADGLCKCTAIHMYVFLPESGTQQTLRLALEAQVVVVLTPSSRTLEIPQSPKPLLLRPMYQIAEAPLGL